MDIKFHEGDFVENNDGRVGYISAICQCDECCKRGFYEPKIEYTDGSEDYITNISVKNIPLNYKQIGTQKFSAEEHYKKKMLAFKLESKIYENKYNELLNLLRKVNSELSEDEFYEKLNILLKKTRNK